MYFIAGAAAGVATSILTSPLDVLRTRLQSDFYASLRTSGRLRYESFTPNQAYQSSILLRLPSFRDGVTLRAFHSILANEGWRTFFRGLGPSLSAIVPGMAVKFHIYGNFKSLGPHVIGCDKDAAVLHALAAIAAGIGTATVTNPIWVVKTRMQLDNGTRRRYKSSFDCAQQTLRQEGIMGLYRGLGASYLGTAETMVHLVLYEQFRLLARRIQGDTKSKSQKEFQQWIETSGAAGLAKLIAVLATYPHEVLRTRLRQVPIENGVQRYVGILQTWQAIRAERGLAGLYGGLTPHLLRSIPSAVISLSVYEFILRLTAIKERN